MNHGAGWRLAGAKICEADECHRRPANVIRLPRFPILPIGIQMHAPDRLKSGPAANCGSGLNEDRKRRLTPGHHPSLLRRLRVAWHKTELLQNGKRVRHDGIFEHFGVANLVDVDRHPLDAIARSGTSEELPAMRATKTIEDYDLVAFRDNIEHFDPSIGDRLIERFVELSSRGGSDIARRGLRFRARGNSG